MLQFLTLYVTTAISHLYFNEDKMKILWNYKNVPVAVSSVFKEHTPLNKFLHLISPKIEGLINQDPKKSTL